jgi:hypothetical protein
MRIGLISLEGALVLDEHAFITYRANCQRELVTVYADDLATPAAPDARVRLKFELFFFG